MVLSSVRVRDEPARTVAGDLLEDVTEDRSSHETYLSMSMPMSMPMPMPTPDRGETTITAI
jgi:hypothetical protein